MGKTRSIVIIGTFDSKSDEHRFLKTHIENRGCPTITINVGAKKPSPFPVDMDLFIEMEKKGKIGTGSRDYVNKTIIREAQERINWWQN